MQFAAATWQVSVDDDVGEFENCLYATLLFVAGQNTELDVIEVIEHDFAGAGMQRAMKMAR
jgi:hypothetical protein